MSRYTFLDVQSHIKNKIVLADSLKILFDDGEVKFAAVMERPLPNQFILCKMGNRPTNLAGHRSVFDNYVIELSICVFDSLDKCHQINIEIRKLFEKNSMATRGDTLDSIAEEGTKTYVSAFNVIAENHTTDVQQDRKLHIITLVMTVVSFNAV